MLTVAALADPVVLLVGRLNQVRDRAGREIGRPRLFVSAWCPGCRTAHTSAWPDASRLDHVETPPPPCESGPWAGGTVAVGLDPDRQAEHRRTLADHAARLRRWRVEQRFRARLADDRAVDRAHLREWGPDLTGP